MIPFFCALFGHRFELVRISNHKDGEDILGSKSYPRCSRCLGICNNRMHYGPSHKCDSLIDIEDVQAVGGPESW